MEAYDHILMVQFSIKVELILFRICWRPLNINLADYEIEVIEAFVAKTLGK